MKALIIDDAYGKIAKTYYTRFPEEPIQQGLTTVIEKPSFIANTSLDTMLSSIISAWKGKDFDGNDLLLVSHGNDRGLTMRLFPGHATDSRTEVLEVLLDTTTTRESKAKMLKLTVDQLDRLTSKIADVQALKLSVIEFRGCNIGKVIKNLDVLKKLFGASGWVGGPDELSTFGIVTPRFAKNSAQFDKWNDTYGARGNGFAHINRIIFDITPIPKAHSDRIDLYVEDKSIIPEWLTTKMSNTAPRSFQHWMEANLPVHYLTVIPPILPLDGSNQFTVPSSQSYVYHIKRSS